MEEFVTGSVSVRQIGAPDLILVKAVTRVNRLTNVKLRVQNYRSLISYSKLGSIHLERKLPGAISSTLQLEILKVIKYIILYFNFYYPFIIYDWRKTISFLKTIGSFMKCIETMQYWYYYTGCGKKTSPIWRGRCGSCGGDTAA
jgi:hypothetical protein